MTAADVLAALALPPEAVVDKRIAKKLLLENGAPTAADKKRITEGVDEITWVAALKPETVGVPAYKDEAREYLEIAVLTLTLRKDAKAARIGKFVHRAIQYPLLLLTTSADGLALSLAHIRHAENEAGKTVLDGDTFRAAVTPDAHGTAFVNSLALAGLRAPDLHALYQEWIDRADALAAARVCGSFRVCATRAATERRRALLARYAELDGRVAALEAAAGTERQLNRRVELNLQLRNLRDERAGVRDALAAGD